MEAMNSYRRVYMAYTKQPYDHVPIYCGSVSSAFASKVLGKEAYVGGGVQRYREALALWQGKEAHQEFLEKSKQDAWDWASKLDFDLVRHFYWRYPRKPDERLDEYTFLFKRPDQTYYIMRYYPESELFQCVKDTAPPIDDVDKLEDIVLTMEKNEEKYNPTFELYKDYLDTMAYFKYEKATYTGGLSLAVPSTEPIWLEATVLRPDLVDRYLDVQMNRALKNIPVLAAVGSKFVFGGGDCAGNRGLLYSPAVFKNQIVPRLRRISDKCKEYGIFHSFGSDGYFWDVADSLYIDSGIDAHYEADCICGMDIRSIRSKYPNITVLGGISSATLETGTEDEVRAQTMEAINAAKELGGAIVGCSNLITPATPMKNFTLMMDLLHRYK
jgi:hypothetical protein